MNWAGAFLTLPRLALLALLSLLALSGLYRLSAVDTEDLRRTELVVSEIGALDIGANLEVMKLRHRDKMDYDSLVASDRKIGALLQALGPDFARLGLESELEPVHQAWQAKEAGIERFKQLNSILSTSQFHFVNLADDLGRHVDSPRLNQLSRRLLAFLIQGGNNDLPFLVANLYQLEFEITTWPQAYRKSGELLITHGNLILEQYRRAHLLSRQLIESPFPDRLGTAYRAYNEAHRQAASRANDFRRVLAGFAFLLVAGVVFALLRLRQSSARLHLAAHVVDSLAEAMVITDKGGRIRSVNPAFTAITGFTEAESLGRRPGELLASGQHDAPFFAAMWTTLKADGQWQGEIINRRKNGELYTEWLSISAVRDRRNRVVQYVGLFSDISDRKQAEAYIHHLAYHDALTGLANRILFRDRLDTALRQAQRCHRPLAVLMMDLDRFKNINDTLGHAAGDRLLKEVAGRLGASIRDCDTLARLGGDEFALLMPEVHNANDAASLARKLLQALAPEIDLGVQEVFITTSIGIAVFPEHGNSGEELLRNADVALYEAKNGGRNTWHVFDPSAAASDEDRLGLETDLRHALGRGELVLHYQLQVDAASHQVSGAEALVRWQHPERGLLSPDRFIPLAEQTGLIDELGAWCLEEACTQLARWQAEGIEVPRMAVNVSVRQLRTPGFAERVMAVVRRTGIAPGQLELELTETMLSDDAGLAFAIFTELRRQGVRIAIDDFGTGYSSLNYLAQFPVDVIKIDRSFVRNLDGHSESSYLVRAIILLARSMRMETVAEGVEMHKQRSELATLGCDHLQGFLFAYPQPGEAIPELFRELTAAEPAPH